MKEDKVYLKYKEFAKQYKLSNYDTKKLWKIIEPIATHEEFAKRCSDPYFHHDIKTLGDHILCDAIVTYKLATGLEALFGYLFLEKRYDRIKELMDLIVGE